MEETPVRPRGQYFQLPLGGTRELGSHKGYGLALMVETMHDAVGDVALWPGARHRL